MRSPTFIEASMEAERWLKLFTETTDLIDDGSHRRCVERCGAPSEMTSEAELIEAIKEAFKKRSMPKGRIIDPEVDLSYHLEARRVDAYIREHRDINRSNSALSAFYYLTDEAALWIMPYYMMSLIEKYDPEDFMIDVVVGALSSGMPGARYKLAYGLGLRLLKRKSAPP
jgi:hypothetical protein